MCCKILNGEENLVYKRHVKQKNEPCKYYDILVSSYFTTKPGLWRGSRDISDFINANTAKLRFGGAVKSVLVRCTTIQNNFQKAFKNKKLETCLSYDLGRPEIQNDVPIVVIPLHLQHNINTNLTLE